jgi:hypothetical protein
MRPVYPYHCKKKSFIFAKILTTDFTDSTDRKCLIREIRVIRGHSDLIAALPRWDIRGQCMNRV